MVAAVEAGAPMSPDDGSCTGHLGAERLLAVLGQAALFPGKLPAGD